MSVILLELFFYKYEQLLLLLLVAVVNLVKVISYWPKEYDESAIFSKVIIKIKLGRLIGYIETHLDRERNKKHKLSMKRKNKEKKKNFG